MPAAALPLRRAVFISDVHLGSRHCHAEELVVFLSTLRCKRLYLVGDIIDLWWMAQRRAQWGSAQNRGVTHFGNLQEKFGDWLYYRILTGNQWLNVVRGRLGLRYWSLSEFLKSRSGAAERYIARFMQAGMDDARRRGLDGIVCGHIHRAALLQSDGVVYANDGDWVESLSALVEEPDGTLLLLAHTGGVPAELLPRSQASGVAVPMVLPRAA